jgi:UDP-2,3-diacylglucosamine hydrolase
MKAGRKIYFASDLHLGVPDYESSLVREKKFVLWLDTVKEDAEEIHLVGDVFDFWFEYKRVVPRGFVRLLGKIAELSDSGIMTCGSSTIFPRNLG